MLEGATHAFDEPKAKDMRVRYDPALTERAHGMYADFLNGLAERLSRRLSQRPEDRPDRRQILCSFGPVDESGTA